MAGDGVESASFPPLLASLHATLNSFLTGISGNIEATKGLQSTHSKSSLASAPVHDGADRPAKSKALTTTRSPASLSALYGTWIKDKSASDSMEPMLRLMHMRGIVRQAVKLVKGINLKHSQDALTLEVFSVIGWFKVVERYRFDGQPASFKRRDLRRGDHTGSLRLLPPATPALTKTPSSKTCKDDAGAKNVDFEAPDRFAIDLTWGDPHGGTSVDLYELVSPDMLRVYTTLYVQGEEVTNCAVFTRKK